MDSIISLYSGLKQMRKNVLVWEKTTDPVIIEKNGKLFLAFASYTAKPQKISFNIFENCYEYHRNRLFLFDGNCVAIEGSAPDKPTYYTVVIDEDDVLCRDMNKIKYYHQLGLVFDIIAKQRNKAEYIHGDTELLLPPEHIKSLQESFNDFLSNSDIKLYQSVFKDFRLNFGALDGKLDT